LSIPRLSLIFLSLQSSSVPGGARKSDDSEDNLGILFFVQSPGSATRFKITVAIQAKIIKEAGGEPPFASTDSFALSEWGTRTGTLF